MAQLVEWSKPFSAWWWIEITADKVIELLLREQNNLIEINSDREAYVDLQLADWIAPTDNLPVWVTVGKVLEADWWLANGTLLNFKTTSWDYGRWLYTWDNKMYYDAWSGTFTQIYSSTEVNALFTQLRWELASVAFTWDYNDLINRPVIVQLQADWNQTDTTSPDYIKNKPTIPTKTSELENDSDFVTKWTNQLVNYTMTNDLAPVALSNDYDDLTDKPTIWTATVTIQKNGTDVKSFWVNDTADSTVNITMSKSDVGLWNVDNTSDANKPISTATQNALNLKANTADLATVATTWDYVDLLNKPTIPAAQVNSDWNASSGVAQILNKPTLATVATSWDYADLSNKPTIPSVIDNVTSSSSTDALSAKQGKNLQDQIDDLKALGKFLSLWDASTWQPISFPEATPYSYSTWDYYLVETIASGSWTNYRPSGSSYTWTASTTAETDELEVWDLYIYDGTTWLLQINHGKTVSFANLAWQPSDNTALATALNSKADSSSLATVATTWSYNDLTNKPTIPSAQVNSDWDASSWVAQILNKPTLATVATTGSYSDLSNKPTIWNATITIQKNWTSVDTFTTNATSNKSINITVPTKTSDITNDSNYVASTSLATVATTGSYNDLQDKPTIPSGQIQSDWTQTTTTAVDYIKNKPSLATVATTWAYSDLSGKPTIPTVNNVTINFKQNSVTKWSITTNQSAWSDVVLETTIPVTQSWYDALPSSKTTDWNLYIIYW